jgi:hypothetical protein
MHSELLALWTFFIVRDSDNQKTQRFRNWISLLPQARRRKLLCWRMASSGMLRRVALRRLLVTANIVPSSPILVTLMMEALGFSETSLLPRATRRHIPEHGILHRHRRENLKSYKTYSFGFPRKRLRRVLSKGPNRMDVS